MLKKASNTQKFKIGLKPDYQIFLALDCLPSYYNSLC